MSPNVLRYPYEAITDKTDYLQLTIKEYNAAGPSLIRSSLPAATAASLNTASLYKQTLAQDGIILLPMPSNIQDSNSVSYSDDSLDSITAKIANASGTLMKTPYNNDVSQFINDTGKNALEGLKSVMGTDGLKKVILDGLAAQAAGVFGGNVTLNQILARSRGQILNPNMELLFNGVTLRTFRFSFKMTPRDGKESEQVKLIIRSLKKNMAAKQGGGTFLKSPNVFDLVYKQGPDEHKFLHKFKPAALTDMSVNYTGENVYATYYDGTPVSITMDLTFKELVPIYEDEYDKIPNGVGF
jgi:hypothetical protein